MLGCHCGASGRWGAIGGAVRQADRCQDANHSKEIHVFHLITESFNCAQIWDKTRALIPKDNEKCNKVESSFVIT